MNRRSASDYYLAAGWIAAFLALFFLCPGSVEAASSKDESRLTSELSSSLSRLGKEKFQALVRIRCRDEAGEISGTGFLIDPTGTVCTLAEFLRDGNGVEVECGGKTFPATVLSVDERTGIAFLRTAIAATSFIPPFPSSKLADNSPIEVLVASTSERGQTPLPLLGTTGQKVDHDGERFFPVPMVTARLPEVGTKPGTPAFDLSGKFAGIVVRPGFDNESCTLLPATAVEKLHGDLLRFGKINPGWIGAVVEEAAVPEGTSRTRIAAVEQGSPAERAGIHPGDSLISIGDRSIVMPQEVLESSFYLTAGQDVRIVLSRSGEVRRVTLRCATVPRETALTQK